MTTLPKTHLPDGQPASTAARSAISSTNLRPYLLGTPKHRSLRPLGSGLVFLPHETEDTRITGGTRSLIRRLMALNIQGSLGRKKSPVATPTLPGSAPKIA